MRVQAGRRAVKHSPRLSRSVKQEQGWNSGNVAERLRGHGVGDGPTQVRAERAGGRAYLVFGRFCCQGENLKVVAVLALQLARPFERGAAARAPRGPEFHQHHTSGELLNRIGPVLLDSSFALGDSVPGIPYGLLKRNYDLYEFGVAFPVGLDRGRPRYATILQLQFEHVFRLGSD